MFRWLSKSLDPLRLHQGLGDKLYVTELVALQLVPGDSTCMWSIRVLSLLPYLLQLRVLALALLMLLLVLLLKRLLLLLLLLLLPSLLLLLKWLLQVPVRVLVMSPVHILVVVLMFMCRSAWRYCDGRWIWHARKRTCERVTSRCKCLCAWA